MGVMTVIPNVRLDSARRTEAAVGRFRKHGVDSKLLPHRRLRSAWRVGSLVGRALVDKAANTQEKPSECAGLGKSL
jgi:hypothetical protein